MVARNPLLTAPPYAVEQSLKRLGADLRTARLRRNLSVRDVAQKIGTGPRAVQDAEKGKPSTSAAVYAALLWTFDLLGQLDAVAAPDRDEEGKILASARDRQRARRSGGSLSDDF
ncbi:helix-turn-helix domain-containing protein [Azospirillum halopraeferens]|uniref:helix-turn-helix domain-containing protein n=1 Tax=Azospirillum halopraeferens TaxID=34010 RepID=UPI00040930B9|nr:helix-turn-helix transcriptional regulator [Azospirillum halopraeferens]